MTGSYLIHRGVAVTAALILIFGVVIYNVHQLIVSAVLPDSVLVSLASTIHAGTLIRLSLSVFVGCTGARLLHAQVAQKVSNPMLLRPADGGPSDEVTKSNCWRQKHVFITGGSEGTGFEVAKILVCDKQARAVTLFSRSQKKLDAAKADLEKLQGKAIATIIRAVSGDVTSVEALEKGMAESSSNECGFPDVVICAAGIAIPDYFENLTQRDFDMQMHVNYMGVVNSARAFLAGSKGTFLSGTPRTSDQTSTKSSQGVATGGACAPLLLDTSGGSESSQQLSSKPKNFVAVSSYACAVPFIGYAAYAPTKVAVRAFCDVLRNEFADVPHVGIHICFPPDMDTPGFAEENKRKPIETKKAFPECFNELFPPADVANMILSGVENNDYHISSPDVVGNFIVSAAWGHYPRPWLLVEMMLAPLFVLLKEVIVLMVDSAVVRYAHHAKTKDEKKKK
ncbi:unnamed protein product [Amoebophrya sp. A25]|nr:unnamed protein product [Amoebophrya sp. A25]|eukprot:GSA25T00009888001.1